MENTTVPIEGLIEVCEKAIETFQLTTDVKSRFMKGIGLLRKHLQQDGVSNYKPEEGERYIVEIFEQNISKYRRMQIIPAIRAVNAYLKGEVTYTIPKEQRYVHKSYRFPGDIGAVAEQFINERTDEKCLSLNTVRQYKRVLSKFAVLMELRHRTLQDLSEADIIAFISSTHNSDFDRLSILRFFMSYLYDNKITITNLSHPLIGKSRRRPTKLPSYYEAHEIASIENAICKSGKKGLRDYAMILLASRLGLRSSDILDLKLSDIDWDAHILRLMQHKTRVPIELPLIPIVGNAIASYLRYGRPKSNLKNVFLSCNFPVRPLMEGTFREIVVEYMHKAGVGYDGKHHGPHSLRHSLASQLLKNGVAMPVISEALGHQSTDTTMSYLAIDNDALLLCANDVVLVKESFYTQKDKYFYG